MYGGLFGDLPATKNSDATTTTADTTTTNISTAASSHGSQTGNGSGKDGHQPVPTTTTTTATTTKTIAPAMIVPHRIRPTVLQQHHSMRPRQPQSHIRKRPVSTFPSPQEQSKDVVQVTDNHIGKATTESSTASEHQKPGTSSNTDAVTVEETKNDSVGNYPSASIDINTNIELELEDRLRILNETAIERNDIYNPMMPNDVLVYWEQQVTRKEHEKYERERQSLLQEQEMIRQQLEQERNQLLQQAIRAEQQQQQQQVEDATKVDDMAIGTLEGPNAPTNTALPTTTNEYYQKIIQQEQHRTMGQGRGNIASNLPAWLIQKQQQQQQQASLPPSKEK
jgi:hypothetical protein